MVFAPNICTVKAYGKSSVKYKSAQIWNELVQHLNLDLLDQSRPKAKKEKLLNISLKNRYHKNQ